MTLITRHHVGVSSESEATYSSCETYRYTLKRTWAREAPKLLFIMLNPSTATELANDPTIERCERRARALGYGAMQIANIFAYRATDPRELKKTRLPVGEANSEALIQGVDWADHVLCAWGVHGDHLDQGRAVAQMLTHADGKLRTLGVTKAGHPRHPLYVAYAHPLVPWTRNDIGEYLQTRTKKGA